MLNSSASTSVLKKYKFIQRFLALKTAIKKKHGLDSKYIDQKVKKDLLQFPTSHFPPHINIFNSHTYNNTRKKRLSLI